MELNKVRLFDVKSTMLFADDELKANSSLVKAEITKVDIRMDTSYRIYMDMEFKDDDERVFSASIMSVPPVFGNIIHALFEIVFRGLRPDADMIRMSGDLVGARVRLIVDEKTKTAVGIANEKDNNCACPFIGISAVAASMFDAFMRWRLAGFMAKQDSGHIIAEAVHKTAVEMAERMVNDVYGTTETTGDISNG